MEQLKVMVEQLKAMVEQLTVMVELREPLRVVKVPESNNHYGCVAK